MPPRTPLLTTQEASRLLDLSPAQVRLYCRRGDLPATRVGRDWLIKETDAARFVPPPRGRRWPAKAG